MLEIIYDEKLTFNTNYSLKYDIKRFELIEKITNNLFKKIDDKFAAEDIYMSIHPLLALLLSFFDGNRSVKTIIDEYSKLVGFNKVHIDGFVRRMIAELSTPDKGKYLEFGDSFFYMPKNLLLKENESKKNVPEINPEHFMIHSDELDLKSYRSYLPTDCLLELNFKCHTDCIYCYADRKKIKDCTIPISRLKEIIREAKNLKMRSFDLSGGELFLYENWEILLQELLENGFMPYISTKIPISEDIIKKLKHLGIEGIQFSLDSMVEDELKHILNVGDDYLKKMMKSIEDLDKEEIKIAINSQITSINDNLVNTKKMLDYFVNLKNIRSIRFGVAGFSIYKSADNYKKIAPSLGKVLKIEELIKSYKESYQNISISFSGYNKKESIFNDHDAKQKSFSERARCSGNFYAFVILPDGKVTVCEELYFHPRFIIGDLTKQSILEVWNSSRALDLYNISKEMLGPDSACKKCDQFDSCHKLKGVCWKNVLIAYGYENWDYPDPRCPYAPKPAIDYWMKG